MAIIRIVHSIQARDFIRGEAIATAGSLICLIIGSGMMCSLPCEDEVFRYTDDLQAERILVLDTTRIWIDARGGLQNESQALLAKVGLQVSDLEPINGTQAYFAPVPRQQADTCGIQAMVAELASGTGFTFVSPVFLNRNDIDVIHGFLFVTFVPGIMKDEAEQILREAGTNGLPTDNPTVGAQLISIPTRSGFTVFETANRLLEHPLVVNAQPYLISPWPYDD